jgi:endonuclease/exonuclease/phosphatase family metal-dependent hydrolase
MLGLSIAIAAIFGANPSEPEVPVLRIMTYNIHHGEGLDGVLKLERIAAIIRTEKPHVVCLQEVDRNLPRTNHLDFPAIFAEMLGMHAVFEPNYQFAGGDYGNATLTSLEIVESKNQRLPGPEGVEPRGCLRVTVRFDGAEVDIFNTHFGLRPDERLQQAEAVLGMLTGRPAILSGDLNETTSAAGLRLLLETFTDTAAIAGTADTPTLPGSPRRIDYILATGGWHVLSSRVLNTAETRVASDHFPWLAEVRLERTPPESRTGGNPGN